MKSSYYNVIKDMDTLEKVLLSVLAVTAILGLYWGFMDPVFFTDRYMMEDGEIEYGTVVLLLGSCLVVGARWWHAKPVRSRRFTFTSLVIIMAFIFVAGEELSWGQRIFGLESTEYFKQHNAQEELNLHNLMIGEVKLNKLVFGLLLTSAIITYLVLVPFLYHRVVVVRKFLDQWYIPIPRLRHSILYLLVMLAITVIPASKNWELLEFGSVLVFFLILRSPVNSQLFTN